MSTILIVLAAWCALSALFAGAHRRWIRYEVASPSPMDVLRALPPFVARPHAAPHAATSGRLPVARSD